VNKNVKFFFEKKNSCKKIGDKAIECRKEMVNRYNVCRMVQYFNIYYYICNKFGNKDK
jgi:hypothetical protein